MNIYDRFVDARRTGTKHINNKFSDVYITLGLPVMQGFSYT